MAINKDFFHKKNDPLFREKPLGNPEYDNQVFVHPEDKALIRNVIEKLSNHDISALFVPFLTGTTLAFIARHISVITVGHHKATYYTPDPSFMNSYRNLYSFRDILISDQFSIQACGSKNAKGWLAQTPSQIPDAAESDFIIADARNLGSIAYLKNFIEMVARIDARVLFLFREHNRMLERFLKNHDCIFEDDKALDSAVALPGGSLGNHYARLNNYSGIVEMEHVVIDTPCPPLQNLQNAFNTCLEEIRDYGIGWSMAFRYVSEINRYYQNFVCPSSHIEEAKVKLGGTGWGGYLLFIRNEAENSEFRDYSTALLAFCECVDKVRNYLRENHFPKTAWLIDTLNSSGEDISLYCQSEEEHTAVDTWMNYSVHNYSSEVQPVDRKYLLQKSCERILVSPGPHIIKNHWIAPSGAAAIVRVLIYPWQKGEWNRLKKKVGSSMKNTSRFFKAGEIESDSGDYEEEEDKLELPPQSDMALVFRDYSEHVSAVQAQVEFGTEEYGAQRCGINSLIPTLSEGKFVDRAASELSVGDIIWIRTDGLLIDARHHVDSMAKVDPHLKEAAEKAGAWRRLFFNVIVDRYGRDCFLPDIYGELYPDKQVTFAAFVDWVLEPTRIAPIRLNLQELMIRLGYTEELANKFYKDISYYYGLRRRIYAYMGRKIRKHLSRTYSGTLDLEVESDYEVALTFEAIDNMVKFATVSSVPAIID